MLVADDVRLLVHVACSMCGREAHPDHLGISRCDAPGCVMGAGGVGSVGWRWREGVHLELEDAEDARGHNEGMKQQHDTRNLAN